MRVNDPAKPETYGRRVLLTVSGMSPQIITETLYALAVAGKPRWVPAELHVLTTTHGARLVRERLLGGKGAAFHDLCWSYKLRGVAFDAARVHVVTDAHGEPLDDVATPPDNAAMADHITRLVAEFTRDPDCALHASLAGGRKTMSYYTGYAMSLYGRAQDRLSHVLVEPDFEANAAFYFPTAEPCAIATPKGRRDCRDAKVALAEIPFVRLRDGLPKSLLDGTTAFSRVVRAAQKSVEKPRVRVQLAGARSRVWLGDVEVGLSPVELRFYLTLLRARQAGWEIEKHRDRQHLAAAIMAAERDLARDAVRERAEIAPNDFEMWRSRCEKAIKNALGPSTAKAYCVEARGARPHTIYSLAGIAPRDIVIAPAAPRAVH